MTYLNTFLPLYYRADVDTGSSQLNSNRTHALMTNSGSPIQLAISHALVLFYETFPSVAISKIEVEFSNRFDDYVIKIKGIDVDNKYEIKIDLKEHRLVEQKLSLLSDHIQNGVGLSRKAIDLKNVRSFDEIVEQVNKEISEVDFYKCELEGQGKRLKWEFKFKKEKQTIEVDIDAETGRVFDVDYDE